MINNQAVVVRDDDSDTAVSGIGGTHPVKASFKFLWAIVSGLLLTLAFPHADIGWFAFFAVVPFLRTFPYARSRAAFGHGFLFGLTYFCCLLYWIAVFAETKIGAFGVGAWLILSARESLWVGLFAMGFNQLSKRTTGVIMIVGAASLWTAIEWARQLGQLGFGWGDLAYSQSHFLPFIQIASIAGIWGVSFLIMLTNAALATGNWRAIAATAAVIFLVCIVGQLRIANHKISPERTVVASLQENVSEDVPYSGLRPADSSYFYGTLNQFDRMAEEAKSRYGASLCVTAETSIPGYPNLDYPLKSILINIAKADNVDLIAGARDIDPVSQEDTNSVFVYHPNGSVSGPYNKQQLVPFGEYVPGRSTFPFLNSFHVLDFDMHAGAPGQPPLDAGDSYKAGIAVCYESTYPRFLREQVRQGATFDVVVTDDTWYGRTAAAQQHFEMSVLRAVETDRSLVRCATTGISGIISPTGAVLSSAGLFKQAIVAGTVEQRHDMTPFVRYGDWFPILCLIFSFISLILRGRSDQ